MKRRDMLKASSAAILGVSAFPFGWAAAADEKKQKVLYFTQSAGFQHSVVARKGDQLSHSEKVLTEMGQRAGFDVVCSKDGRIFDGDLDQFDAIAFYTSGDLTKPNKQNNPPMSARGKQRLLNAVAAGKGFVALHAATDSFHTPGPRNEIQTEVDPYIGMVGGEFLTHGAQEEASLRVTSQFPTALGNTVGDKISYTEEWYSTKNFAQDLHVILVQETGAMTGDCYQRPEFPSTWARMQGKGRVFYTSLGHREDVWTSPVFQAVTLGGFAWVMGNTDFDIRPNIAQVTPHANQLKN
jgi:type 1 glutamine amidotransferase